MLSRELARELRTKGHSYAEISRRTGLAKSTLSYHLKGVPFTPNSLTVKNVRQARERAVLTIKTKKRDTLRAVFNEAEREVGKVTPRDLLMLGIGLYLGEGSKTAGVVRLVNTDPRALRLFIRWLYALGLSGENIKLRVHAYPETDIDSAQKYWLHQLKLPDESLQRACIDRRRTGSERKKGQQLNGTAHLTVRSNGQRRFGKQLFYKIGAYFDLVLE